MESLLLDAARESIGAVFRPMTLFPILGALSLTKVWRLDHRRRTGRTPRTYECALLNTVICWALMTIVYGTLGGEGWGHAFGMGAMVAPAAPLLWVVGGERLIECIAARLCGRKGPRNGANWTPGKRRAVRDLYDTMSDADESTLRNQLRKLREDEREWRGDKDA